MKIGDRFTTQSKIDRDQTGKEAVKEAITSEAFLVAELLEKILVQLEKKKI
jgi:hypothetical protein